MHHDDWDDRYRGVPRMSSGNPNPTLVTEASPLRPGRALDIGCGEGADSIWLAEHGWTVTGIDIAPTALARAAEAESPHVKRITWVECDITNEPAPTGPYDLVTMHYIPLRTQDADRVLSELLPAVAHGGVFLFVTHDLDDLSTHGDVDPRQYCQPSDIAMRLGPEWAITTEGARLRSPELQQTTPHTRDQILAAHRH